MDADYPSAPLLRKSAKAVHEIKHKAWAVWCMAPIAPGAKAGNELPRQTKPESSYGSGFIKEQSDHFVEVSKMVGDLNNQ